MNESDYNTTPPGYDEAYLDESEPDPTLSESDFDMSAPPADESYLDAPAADDAAADGAPAPARTPGVALVALLGVVALAALALRRR